MTTSYWDRLELRKQFAGCVTLKEIITKLESDFSQRGEVICEIRVNGMTLDEEDEARFAESSSEDIRELAVLTNPPDQLIVDALNSTTEFLPSLNESCLNTSDILRGGSVLEAQQAFGKTLDGCQWLVDTLTHVRGAASGIGKPVHRTERWFEAEKVIARVIREVSDAYAANDSVLVADLLEYELTAALQIWGEAIREEIRLRAEKRPPLG